MKTRTTALATFAALATLTALATLAAAPARAAGPDGFRMEVLVDGATAPELFGRGNVYVEALRERPYSIRLTNPLGVRVAVALSVDGRNTIDAKRTSAWGAAKWVLEPYESTVISGWQVDGATARRFTFTTEKKSYAAWLGDSANLGIIEAVFYRERMPLPPPPRPWSEGMAPGAASGMAEPRRERAAQKSAEALSDSAATGMGDPTAHPVTSVALELESRPAAQVRIRYEFREQLASLGILPRETTPPARREHATGFESYCPQPR